MNKFQVILALATIVIASGEPPVLSGGYGYSQPHHGGGGIGGLIIGGGGGISGLSGISGHGFTSIGHGGGGYQTHEGQHVDPQLLHKIKQILLEHEQLENAHHGHHNYITAPSDSYGPPSSHYGAPSYHHNEHVVGIELGHVQPSIQVAHYHQAEHQHHLTGPGISYGVPSISIPSGSYGPPPSIHIPSGSYGVPSDSYGAPHH